MLAHCATCPGCGAWIIIHRDTGEPSMNGKTMMKCPNPACRGCQFEVANRQTMIFDVDQIIFDQRFFYPCDLKYGFVRKD